MVLIEECDETRDMLIQFLSSEGCLVTHFATLGDSSRYLKTSLTIPMLILAGDHFSLSDWKSFNEHLFRNDRLKNVPILTYQKPMDMKKILTNICGILLPP